MNQLWINFFTGMDSAASGCVSPGFLNMHLPAGNYKRQALEPAVGSVTAGSGVSPHFFRQHRHEKSAGLTPPPAVWFYSMPASMRRKVEAVSATTPACGTLAGIRLNPPEDKPIVFPLASRPICPLIAATTCILFGANGTRLPAAIS